MVETFLGVVVLIAAVIAVIVLALYNASPQNESNVKPDKPKYPYTPPKPEPTKPSEDKFASMREKRMAKLDLMKEKIIEEAPSKYKEYVRDWKKDLAAFKFKIEIVGDYIMFDFEGTKKYTASKIISLNLITRFDLEKGFEPTSDRDLVYYDPDAIYWDSGRSGHRYDNDELRTYHGVPNKAQDDFLILVGSSGNTQFRIPHSRGDEVYKELMRVLSENKNAATSKPQS